jgi:hypothetical protein
MPYAGYGDERWKMMKNMRKLMIKIDVVEQK